MRSNFPDLGRQLRSVKLGMVDYKHLADPHSPTDFLTHLMQDELGGNPADAVIFAGPKAFIDEPVTPDKLKAILEPSTYPVFYMNYMRWRGRAIRRPGARCDQVDRGEAPAGLRIHDYATPRFMDFLD